MKNLYSWESLREYGINPLTGEACSYGMRLLCDLTERGAYIVAGYFGLNYDPCSRLFPENWNSRINGETAVASFMLPRDAVQSLLRYIAFNVEEAHTVVETPSGTLVALNKNDSEYAEYLTILREDSRYRVYHNPVNPTVSLGGRNIHMMTGRVT